LIATQLYQKSVIDKITGNLLDDDYPAVFLYGPQNVGKTFLAKTVLKKMFEKHSYYVHYLDCNAISAQL
jgi:predicted AAA+ superfamily ATPase